MFLLSASLLLLKLPEYRTIFVLATAVPLKPKEVPGMSRCSNYVVTVKTD